MSHKFDVKNKHKLDNEQRRAIMPPEETLLKLGLKSGDVVADIGSGAGYFTIPASEIVGEIGLVYAMDISEEMLAEIQKKVSNLNIQNIKTIKTEENNFKSQEDFYDFILISNVLHEAVNTRLFLLEVRNILKPQGKLAIIDWQKSQMEFGPPLEHRIAQDSAVQFLQDLNFEIEQVFELGNQFYAIQALKK